MLSNTVKLREQFNEHQNSFTDFMLRHLEQFQQLFFFLYVMPTFLTTSQSLPAALCNVIILHQIYDSKKMSPIERQKGLTTGQLHTQLDPIAYGNVRYMKQADVCRHKEGKKNNGGKLLIYDKRKAFSKAKITMHPNLNTEYVMFHNVAQK